MSMQIPMITLMAVAVLSLLAAVLAIQVIVKRVRLNIEWGDGGNLSMAQAVRAHANFVEHVPIALLALGAAELSGAPKTLVAVCAGALVLARCLSAFGLSRSLGPSIPRQTGASISILVVMVSAIATIRALL
jgi:uncharacterized protein